MKARACHHPSRQRQPSSTCDPALNHARAIYCQRGASVEPVFGQMKERQDAGRFSMRGLVACRGEWHLQAATHNLRKLHRESVRRARAAIALYSNGRRTEQKAT